MFRNLVTKKRALVLGVVAALAVAGIAAAYWTTTGSGEGSGKVAASNGTLALHGSISNELTPGASSPVTFSADNSGTSSLQVGTVSAKVVIDESHATAGCKASDFTISPTAENQVIAKESSGVALAHNGSISMTDSGENQDACKGASITLELSS